MGCVKQVMSYVSNKCKVAWHCAHDQSWGMQCDVVKDYGVIFLPLLE